jgi:hypothetical protein
VDRGLIALIVLCSTATVGLSPSIKSNGFSSSNFGGNPIDWRYRVLPSSKRMSKARLDFPEPETPVITIILFFGRSIFIF